ncbi:ABC transporter ATP-binding protein [Konateibacter massiliensis]|uniref:ABC transporter ATP-binding protein n=1 Tax=Konateibacter massiliensis TaxID=2002841 RepID=UPI000C15ECEB|nr:ABC transporter ATP-binding protein [Konateibacter massiliensis]
MGSIIEVNGITKHFQSVKAVDDISLVIEPGELFGFLGVNGAGKSTTINMLCTIYPPTSGKAKICGYDLGKEDEKIRKKIGVVYQNNCLDDMLTVRENLLLRGGLYEKRSRKVKEELREVSSFLSLDSILERPFAKLSGGQKRRCEIARALMHAPEILFLDEPTTGLDPSTRKSVWEIIEKLRSERNMTVFLTTHYMEEAAKASHIAIIDEGKIKEYGTPFSLKEEFAKDQLRLIAKPGVALEEVLRQNNVTFRIREESFWVSLSDTMEALPVLDMVRPHIGGFEVVQGSMDDVFLNVTGRTLEDCENE